MGFNMLSGEMQNENPDKTKVGLRIRELRKRQRLTLQDVADQAGISVSTISKIERGKLTPTYDKFSRIADALGVDLISLYSSGATEFAAGAFLVARKGETVSYENETYVYNMLFSQASGKAMLPAFCSLRPLEEMSVTDHVRHPGQEFVLVLEGTVIIHLEHRTPAVLNTGDCAYFDSTQGHIYSAAGKEGAKVLFLTAPPPTVRAQEEARHGKP